MQAGTVGAVGMVEQKRRTDLADRGRAEALRARHLQYCFFVQIIAAEVLVDIAQYRIVLDEGNDGIASGCGRITGIDRVAEGSGIAEVMPGRHGRSVRHGEGRKQRVWIFEIDAFVADYRHRRRGLGGDNPPA